MKADSGASRKLLRQEDAHILRDRQFNDRPAVHLPDMTTIRSHEKLSLNIPGLSTTENESFVLKKLKSASLLSLGQLCDDNCVVILHKKYLVVQNKNAIIMTGNRNNTDGLWDV